MRPWEDMMIQVLKSSCRLPRWDPTFTGTVVVKEWGQSKSKKARVLATIPTRRTMSKVDWLVTLDVTLWLHLVWRSSSTWGRRELTLNILGSLFPNSHGKLRNQRKNSCTSSPSVEFCLKEARIKSPKILEQLTKLLKCIKWTPHTPNSSGQTTTCKHCCSTISRGRVSSL